VYKESLAKGKDVTHFIKGERNYEQQYMSHKISNSLEISGRYTRRASYFVTTHSACNFFSLLKLQRQAIFMRHFIFETIFQRK
jgi:hypothetical protein